MAVASGPAQGATRPDLSPVINDGPSEVLRRTLERLEPEMRALLVRLLQTPSVSGQEAGMVQVIADWAAAHGLECDQWMPDEQQLAPQLSAAGLAGARHLPLAGRPVLVIRLPGTRPTSARSLVFNAHSDVVAAGDESAWTHSPWSGHDDGRTLFGRGACDVKGPLVSALWAMAALADPALRPEGDVLLELVPGEEDLVGLGTLCSVVRGHHADASIVLEPTENQPRCASRGGLRFEIVSTGRAVHGTVRWLGRDAIAMSRRVMSALDRLEARWNDRSADPLFAGYPLVRPVTVDRVEGGRWQGMVCDRCLVAGYFELLPGDDLNTWQAAFTQELKAELGDSADHTLVAFPETYRGHRTDPGHPLACAAEAAAAEPDPLPWSGFNAGCEAGLRAGLLGTPTLVWGPGSLAHAHAVDERILWDDVKNVSGKFARLVAAWCHSAPAAPTGLEVA